MSDLLGAGGTRDCEPPNIGVVNGAQVPYKLSFQRKPKLCTSHLSQFPPSFSKHDSTTLS